MNLLLKVNKSLTFEVEEVKEVTTKDDIVFIWFNRGQEDEACGKCTVFDLAMALTKIYINMPGKEK